MLLQRTQQDLLRSTDPAIGRWPLCSRSIRGDVAGDGIVGGIQGGAEVCTIVEAVYKGACDVADIFHWDEVTIGCERLSIRGDVLGCF